MKASFLFAELPEGTPEDLVDIFHFWMQMRVTRGATTETLPARASFTADVLQPWLEHIAIAAYQEAENDVLVLRAGRAVTRLLGVDLNLRRFSQALPMISQAAAAAPYRAAMRVRRPTFSMIAIPGFPRVARLILPMETETGAVEFLVAVYSTGEEAAYPSERRTMRYVPSASAHFVILDVNGVREPLFPALPDLRTPEERAIPTRVPHMDAPTAPKPKRREPRRVAMAPKKPKERAREPLRALREEPIDRAPSAIELTASDMEEPRTTARDSFAADDDLRRPDHLRQQPPPLERTMGELRRVLGEVKKPPGWRFARSMRRRLK